MKFIRSHALHLLNLVNVVTHRARRIKNFTLNFCNICFLLQINQKNSWHGIKMRTDFCFEQYKYLGPKNETYIAN